MGRDSGGVSLVAGVVLTVRGDERKQRIDRARARMEKASLTILTHIASALGVDITKMFEEVEESVDEYKDDV